jgi:hypothetical protein
MLELARRPLTWHPTISSDEPQKSQDPAVIGYSDNTWAEDMAPQGCDQSADPAAGNAWAAQAACAAFLAGKR